jgi:hypothetical protein
VDLGKLLMDGTRQKFPCFREMFAVKNKPLRELHRAA